MKKKILVTLVSLMLGGALAAPSQVTGLQFLAALASLRNVPIYDQLKAFVANYSDVTAAIIAEKLRSPFCAVQKAGKAGTKVLSVGEINIIALEARLGRCLTAVEAKSVTDTAEASDNPIDTLEEVAALLFGPSTNRLVIDALRSVTARTPSS